ncbi:hypothetical protein C2857_007374 [Epichloe festucae Fl1]|uniref:Tubulin-specific chaperone D C-terminal domain-containing protein n=1 Tax=Epichloe festucae (strain Fl1) TaxID=877507 RepID=A0A7S9KMA3_EPIFF|nr:hypothetical protein C2857_007374 [Epichloe festucae Fl1]
MDAPEADFDIKLQKISGDLIADLDRGLSTALRKSDAHGGTRVRSFVRARETWKSTTMVLDMFQELPQLLDPHLPRWIPLLAESYLEYAQMRHRVKQTTRQSELLVPVDYAISRILYAFCKVRGEKVVVRFLNVETRYLEVLLSAVEEAEEKSHLQQKPAWEWEQRYVVLLWLSHLLLAPFDLSTISTLDAEDSGCVPSIDGFDWPRNLPGITTRVVPLAIKYLSSPGKEKDAAKALLVRVAMRRDMQQLGVLDALVRWAMASLRPRKDEPLRSTYFYLGVLSFLAGALRSAAETSDMDPYLAPVFHCVYAITLAENDMSQSIIKLAVVRKMILKVIRSVAVSLLRQQQQQQSMANTDTVETAIGYLLENISDNDTPVRLSASKALSIITLKLDPGMASQVVEAVLESLNKNVLWTKPCSPGEKPTRNLSSVNNMEWHGLTLTLSHLLYRRSPPANQLSDIIHALLLGLSFEQRSTSGGSVGANVRDAACFGIWALARRYTTRELLSVPTTSVFAAKAHPSTSSILQVLGTELVVTASLDSAGNIRRGASAALQELIGRHPDTVERGIELVQTVDYHMVARRSRAVEEVATKATALSGQYGEALIDGLFGWRGIGDTDAQSRRVAGAAFGVLTAGLSLLDKTDCFSRYSASIELIMRQIKSLAKRQVEERHGLLLCFASLLDKIAESIQEKGGHSPTQSPLIQQALTSVSEILEDCQVAEYRRPELIAEGASSLVVSALPMLQLARIGQSAMPVRPGQASLSVSRVREYIGSVSSRLTDSSRANEAAARLITSLQSMVPKWLSRNEAETVQPAAAAALILLLFSTSPIREATLEEWAAAVGTRPTTRTIVTGQGYFHALAMAQPIAKQAQVQSGRDSACQALLSRWAQDDDIDVRVTIVQSLIRSSLLHAEAGLFLALLADGLNDYTTNARGDVGSHVRVQALRAVRSLWGNGGICSSSSNPDLLGDSLRKLFPCTLRLSVEKLDRVRAEAQAVLALMMKESDAESFQSLTFSSKAYFTTLLNLVPMPSLKSDFDLLLEHAPHDHAAWMAELMSGLVTSADTGNDDLVVSSRAALTDFCEASQRNLDLVCRSLVRNLGTFPTEDRVAVPTLEIIAFLFHVGLFPRARGVSLRHVCLVTQKAGYKTGNVRKIMACIKVYGGVASLSDGEVADTDADETEGGGGGGGGGVRAGVDEARKRLGALMFHPWPRVRSVAVDEIWGVSGFCEGRGMAKLTSVDWSAAGKEEVRGAVRALGMGQ